MRIASLLVRHVLHASVFVSGCFGALVSNPATVFRDKVHVVGSAVPKHHFVGGVIKRDYQVRIFIDPPKLVPLGIKLQAGIKGAKTLLSIGDARKFAPGEWRRLVGAR